MAGPIPTKVTNQVVPPLDMAAQNTVPILALILHADLRLALAPPLFVIVVFQMTFAVSGGVLCVAPPEYIGFSTYESFQLVLALLARTNEIDFIDAKSSHL